MRGYVDAHTHGMAYEFLGGEVHCGKPWDKYGVAFALVDCQDHTLTGGKGAALEAVLPAGRPRPGRLADVQGLAGAAVADPRRHLLEVDGALVARRAAGVRQPARRERPALQDLPAEAELVRRDDLDPPAGQADAAVQNYIDAQYGGPGKGWYRIVTSPWQARKVINEGKLAVIMGIETSVPFGCTFKNLPGGDVPACDVASIDAQLDEMHQLGVRQMELVNKFDNALTGVAGDEGETGVAVNSANLLETGSYWDMRTCEPGDDEVHDRTQLAQPEISGEQQDALFGAIAKLSDLANLPRGAGLPAGPALQRARPVQPGRAPGQQAGRQAHADRPRPHERQGPPAGSSTSSRTAQYPGVLSSHSWSTPDAYPRIYRLGGFVAPYAGDSTGFYAKWQRHLGWADKRFYFGFGYGADMNGLGAQGNPRGKDVDEPGDLPVHRPARRDRAQAAQRHPRLRRQRRGRAALRHVPRLDPGPAQARRPPDGAAIVDDMDRGAEAYLQTWERAEGIRADACRNPGLRVGVATFRNRVRPGMTTREVQKAVGQPYTRLGSTYGTCARTASDPRVTMKVVFGPRGRVTDVRRSS